ncbi:GntR family transcriptional regulator [Rhizobiales bacterium]|uniref:GntR family transcriptional regulator n=1 Tax=Hongsoonwoonella zoysiae TaxID=2821844 RepID=UPI0015614214|nr:GntR family transcriptional regulator [Hongsoonwoonella zoysiae]NRG18206.1 GntR family transcriptional regulator [Hongsoonwoonella zoysiae]
MAPATPSSEPGKLTRASRVAAELRGEILQGGLRPGAKLNLDQLRERLEVSLSPLREAISRLVAEGLVEIEDQRGFRVAPVSEQNLTEIIEMRADLECLALGLSIERGDIDWESRVLSALHTLQRMNQEPAGARAHDKRAAAHAAFHEALASGCARATLIRLCTSFYDQNRRYMNILFPDPGERWRGADDHGAIAQAAVGRKKGLAVELLRQDIEQAGAPLAARLVETEKRQTTP